MKTKRPDQCVVDHFLDLTDGDAKYYSRHIKASQALLELVDGNVDEACAAIDRTYAWLTGFGDKEDLRIETVIKKFYDLKKL
jgi:hypothetical protein